MNCAGEKSDRLLFASFGRAVQSVSGLYLFPASTVTPSLRVKVCSGLVDVGISGVTGPRLPAPMTVTRQLVSRELRCPAIAGVQAAQPLLAHEFARCLEEVRIVDRRVVRHIRQHRRLYPVGHMRSGGVVVLATKQKDTHFVLHKIPSV